MLVLHHAWRSSASRRVRLCLAEQRRAGEILFRGEPTQLRIETTGARARGNAISFANDEIAELRHSGRIRGVDRLAARVDRQPGLVGDRDGDRARA